MEEDKSITENKYRNDVVQYDTGKILELCNRMSVRLLNEGETIISGNWPYRSGRFGKKQVFHMTHHKLVLLAMIALQNHRYSHGKTPTEKAFIALANNVTTIQNPIDNLQPKDRIEELYSLMILTSYAQFPFQEGTRNVLPRHLLIYLFSKTRKSLVDVDSAISRHFGISIREFLTLGLVFTAASLVYPAFLRSFIENTTNRAIKATVVPDKIDMFLRRTAADYDTFRDMCMQEIEEYPGSGTYRFNPLFDRPIILRKDRRICIPVPMLVFNAITKGLYYELLDIFHVEGEKGNAFSEWFGYAFEYYGGLLLKKTFGKLRVFQEPVYGKASKRGPDWTVIQGNTAIVLEFRSGRLNKKTKVYGDYTDIVDQLRRNIIDPLVRLPGKIYDIQSGCTDIPLKRDMEIYPCIVTYEPLYPNEMIREVIDKELAREGIHNYDYELMSIEDLELLLSWAQYETPFDFLRSKREIVEWKTKSIRDVIGIKMKEKEIEDLRNPLLDKVFNKFWRDIVPESLKEAE